MTQEDRELLIKDLCGRLPYGVKVELMPITKGKCVKLTPIILADYFISDTTNYLPYLRTIEDMTEEEWKELNCIGHIVPLYDGCFGVDMRAYCKNNQPHYRRFSDFSAIEDWLNKNHFDYHYSYDIKEKRWKTMIEKGLAIKAPAGMYNTK